VTPLPSYRAALKRWSSLCPSLNVRPASCCVCKYLGLTVRTLLCIAVDMAKIWTEVSHFNPCCFPVRLPEGQTEFFESKYSWLIYGEELWVTDYPEWYRVPSRRGGPGRGHHTVQHGDSKTQQEASHSCRTDTGCPGRN